MLFFGKVIAVVGAGLLGFFGIKDLGKTVSKGASNTANYITSLLPYIIIAVLLFAFIKYGLPLISGQRKNIERKKYNNNNNYKNNYRKRR